MTKIQTIATIEDILRESGLYWSLAYSPSTDSYHYKMYFHTEVLPDVEIKP